jgi:hypothetical protein
MAASFVAMNQVYGPLFAASPEEGGMRMAQARADGLKASSSRTCTFPARRHADRLRQHARVGGKSGWNKDLAASRQ